MINKKICICGRTLGELYISVCQNKYCPYSNDEVLTESEMVTSRDCFCGRQNFSEYKDCPHSSCVRRSLMEGKVDFMTSQNDPIVKCLDIVDRLQAYAEASEALGTYTEANCAYDAIRTINHLREALRKIGHDYVEFSHDKVQHLYLEHIAIARKAYLDSFPPVTSRAPEHKELKDDF